MPQHDDLGDDDGQALYGEAHEAVCRTPATAGGAAQVIGSTTCASNGHSRPERRDQRVAGSKAMDADSPTARQRLGSHLPRLGVLVLAAVTAGSCVAAALHMHHSATDAEIRQQVQELRLQNQALARSATLARQEQQELATLLFDPESKKRLTDLIERSQAVEEAIVQNGFKSRPENTVNVRACLGRLLFELNITSMLDVPCGGGSWQPLIPGIRNVTYIGGDISLRALEKAKHRPETQGTGMDFMLFDPVTFPLKRAFDLVLFRDAIEQHDMEDALTAVLNFKSSGSTYFAATYWPKSPAVANEAAFTLEPGGWYEANLLQPPFSFPEPMASCENADKGSKHHGRQRLGVWRLQDLPVTAKSVQAARVARARQEGQVPLTLPREVHLPSIGREGPSRGIPKRQSEGRAGRSPGRSQAVTLQDLLENIFEPERRRSSLPFQPVGSPFDGLFSDWLETPGHVDPRGAHVQRWGSPGGPNFHVFQIPRFQPVDEDAGEDLLDGINQLRLRR